MTFFVICLTLFGVIFLPAAKVKLRLWRSEILFALTLAKRISLRSEYHCEAIKRAARRIELKKDLHLQVLFLVGEGGFGPPKSLTTDLQSAPFGHSGIPPYMKL